jgi:hypothetical protein
MSWVSQTLLAVCIDSQHQKNQGSHTHQKVVNSVTTAYTKMLKFILIPKLNVKSKKTVNTEIANENDKEFSIFHREEQLSGISLMGHQIFGDLSCIF